MYIKIRAKLSVMHIPLILTQGVSSFRSQELVCGIGSLSNNFIQPYHVKHNHVVCESLV